MVATLLQPRADRGRAIAAWSAAGLCPAELVAGGAKRFEGPDLEKREAFAVCSPAQDAREQGGTLRTRPAGRAEGQPRGARPVGALPRAPRHVTAALLALARGRAPAALPTGRRQRERSRPRRAGRPLDEIHLVDIDPGALSRATGRQHPGVARRLRSHAPVDLSGLYAQLEAGPRRLPAPDELVAAGTPRCWPRLPVGFDVVASLLRAQPDGLGAREPRDQADEPPPAPEQPLLRIHLRTMLGTPAPRGAALLIADLVSPAPTPRRAARPTRIWRRSPAPRRRPDRLPGVQPGLVRLIIRRDPELAAAASRPCWASRGCGPAPKDLTYLVYPFWRCAAALPTSTSPAARVARWWGRPPG